MRIGFFNLGSCFIDTPGPLGPDPYSRHHTATDYDRAYTAFLNWAKIAENCGYDSFWLTEHHFQREGYEITPNVVLMASVFAQHTSRIKFGSFFHVVPTWHPLRMAEDLALADILTGGRVMFGAGRGSVEREARVFGVDWGRDGDEGDQKNREQFNEQMEIMRLAWEQPEFSYKGKHYTIPPPGILNTGNPLTGRPWDKISLVPQPIRPIQIYQACNSDETLEMCAKAGNTGVFAVRMGGLERTKSRWDAFGRILEESHGLPFTRGAKRMLVARVHLGKSRDDVLRELSGPFIEYARFIAQQRPVHWAKGGNVSPAGFVPDIEEALENGNLIIGTPDEVRPILMEIVEAIGVEELAVQMGFPGMPEETVAHQIELFASEIRPALEEASRVATAPA
jgi:alkanesulfonate monooxygenase SsuD/methylene tetrahydromethanopterin reductase-like flavin-dependent oxidoreductase (luciferase family)